MNLERDVQAAIHNVESWLYTGMLIEHDDGVWFFEGRSSPPARVEDELREILERDARGATLVRELPEFLDYRWRIELPATGWENEPTQPHTVATPSTPELCAAALGASQRTDAELQQLRADLAASQLRCAKLRQGLIDARAACTQSRSREIIEDVLEEV